MKIQRRELIKFLGLLPFTSTLAGCNLKLGNTDDPQQLNEVQPLPTRAQAFPPSSSYTSSDYKPGYLSIVQGPTSDSESLINILAPRLKKFTYEVTDELGISQTVEKYDQLASPIFYKVDKIRVSGLRPGIRYTLKVVEVSSSSGNRTIVDVRRFSTLDTQMKQPRFALVSCMADDYRLDAVIDPMWKRLQDQNVDLLFLTGDLVYVDSKEFVEREKATASDIWQRYADTLNRIPVYHWLDLKPIFATWDDHDFGTNDGDRNFIGKETALQLFQALFMGPSLKNSWSQTGIGSSQQLQAFGQRFYLMDDRYFRQPNKNQTTQEPYGHWGSDQHQWLMADLAKSDAPAWIINGNQIFNGAKKTFVESLEQNHPAEYQLFIEGLKNQKAPVVFASGDIHLSEIMEIPETTLGYKSYEFTSSSMHSYAGSGWENPLRVAGAYTIEFNFMVFETLAGSKNLQVNVKSLGLPEQAYFEKSFSVRRA